MSKQATAEEKILTRHVFDKELVSKTYKEHQHLIIMRQATE